MTWMDAIGVTMLMLVPIALLYAIGYLLLTLVTWVHTRIEQYKHPTAEKR
jgi:hypothetical protein